MVRVQSEILGLGVQAGLEDPPILAVVDDGRRGGGPGDQAVSGLLLPPGYLGLGGPLARARAPLGPGVVPQVGSLLELSELTQEVLGLVWGGAGLLAVQETAPGGVGEGEGAGAGGGTGGGGGGTTREMVKVVEKIAGLNLGP